MPSKDITANHQEYIPTEGQSTYCELLAPGMENVAPYSELSFSSLNAERTLSFFPISVSCEMKCVRRDSHHGSSIQTRAKAEPFPLILTLKHLEHVNAVFTARAPPCITGESPHPSPHRALLHLGTGCACSRGQFLQASQLRVHPGRALLHGLLHVAHVQGTIGLSLTCSGAVTWGGEGS